MHTITLFFSSFFSLIVNCKHCSEFRYKVRLSGPLDSINEKARVTHQKLDINKENVAKTKQNQNQNPKSLFRICRFQTRNVSIVGPVSYPFCRVGALIEIQGIFKCFSCSFSTFCYFRACLLLTADTVDSAGIFRNITEAFSFSHRHVCMHHSACPYCLNLSCTVTTEPC